MDKTQLILLLESRWVSREELCELLGMKDVQVRCYIAALNQKLSSYNKCILSTSTKKGYHIGNPSNDEDIAVARHALEELKNKAISIFERRKVIEDFIKFSDSAKAAVGEVQGTLF